MPQDEHRILELADQIRPPLREFLILMFERSFAASAQTATKNLSGITRNGIKQELKLIDALLCEATNDSIGPISTLGQRLTIGQQLDVAESIYLIGHQLACQRFQKKGRCPIVRMEGDWFPMLTFEFGSNVWERSDPFIEVKFVGKVEDELLKMSDALASEIPNLMERPFAYFIGTRLLESSSLSLGAAAQNVEVQNTQNGWQVIYSPAYLLQRNVLGGPSTPVKGSVSAGTYRFGVARPGEEKWDQTLWNVPTSNPIFIPIP
jgi:hypothetical protein